jgi:hypothetical protein
MLNATIGFTIGAASIKVTPQETGNPLLISRRTTGIMPPALKHDRFVSNRPVKLREDGEASEANAEKL